MPSLVVPGLDGVYRRFLQPPGTPAPFDFASPPGEPSLCPPDSVSWRVCKNPVTLLVGGIAAVVMELAEPRVRAGVWGHTTFRVAPVQRLRRTGFATMVTVYGAHSQARRMIAGIGRRHAAVRGITPEGLVYDATDPELLDWVHATAAIGFLDAWHAWVRPLASTERDAYVAEGRTAGALYGATWAPACEDDWQALLQRMLPRLQASPVVEEFLAIVERAPLLPGALRPMQGLLVRAAVDLVPRSVRERIGLAGAPTPSPLQRGVVRALARAADALVLPSSPPVQACRRLGLPDGWLYDRRGVQEPCR
jgi:uncharacterized protein (DUF2236 family)